MFLLALLDGITGLGGASFEVAHDGVYGNKASGIFFY